MVGVQLEKVAFSYGCLFSSVSLYVYFYVCLSASICLLVPSQSVGVQ